VQRLREQLLQFSKLGEAHPLRETSRLSLLDECRARKPSCFTSNNPAGSSNATRQTFNGIGVMGGN
jgi:hypothetical protein